MQYMFSKTLKLDKDSQSITDLFYTIPKTRRDVISKGIKKVQDRLRRKANKRADFDGYDLLKAIMFSDIAESDEEYIYILITINLFIGEQAGRLKAYDEAKQSVLTMLRDLNTDMKGKKVD